MGLYDSVTFIFTKRLDSEVRRNAIAAFVNRASVKRVKVRKNTIHFLAS